MPVVRKGTQGSAGRKKGWTPGWVGGRKRNSVEGVWTARCVGTCLAVITVLLEASGWMVIKGVQRKDSLLLGLTPTSSILLSFWVSVKARIRGVILAPCLSRIIPTSNQLPRSRELSPR